MGVASSCDGVLPLGIQSLSMVVQTADVSGRLTLLALSCAAQLLRAAERAPISAAAGSAALGLAVRAAASARFELADAASD